MQGPEGPKAGVSLPGGWRWILALLTEEDLDLSACGQGLSPGGSWESAGLPVCWLGLDKAGCGAALALVMVTTHWEARLGPGNPRVIV